MHRAIFLAIFCTIMLNSASQSFANADGEFSNNTIEKQFEWANKKLKKLNHGRDLMPIDGGAFVVTPAIDAELWFDPKDTTLVLTDVAKRVTVNPFFICSHEVTNLEYRAFVEWVVDSISRKHPNEPMYCYHESDFGIYNRPTYNTDKIIYNGVKIYPDTLCWLRPSATSGYSFLQPWAQYYFHHKAFMHHPVVGVNWHQAMAYCSWKTARLLEEAAKKKLVINAAFRLPTEAEWQYATSVRKVKIKSDSIIVVQDSYLPLLDKKGKFRTNIARVVDKNGCVVLKNPSDFATTHAFSYPQNYFKLYHMRGNVSEWMLDNRPPFCVEPTYSDTTGSAFREHIKQQLITLPLFSEKVGFVTNRLNAITGELAGMNLSDNDVYYKKLITERDILFRLRTEIISNRPDLRIVKGGSWQDGAIFQHIGSSEMIPATTSRPCTGFRVAMSMPVP